jgi:FlaA1/EpsC-like NDP-sugar epimerase
MGATKRMAELVIKDLATRSETTFCAVRFGNVLGSRGSVVPIFTKQIERGGPITITHPDVKRFFMTIPEAVSLVIEAGSFATPGDTFVLEMGEQLKILDLAEKMVRFRGLRLGKDVKIVYTGLRPGEKLAEELVGESETILPTGHPKVMRLNDCAVCPDTQVVLSVLERMLESGSSDAIRAALFDAALREAAPAAALPTLVAPAE